MESKNNNKENSQISSGIIVSENSIYLKRSDLPKNVSSFNNDANYISEDALNEWLQNHSYLSESDIKSLIEKNNIVIINEVNKTSDENTIKQLESYIDKIAGDINAIIDKLNDYNEIIESLKLSSIELQNKEKDYAKKDDIDDLKNTYASKKWVEGKKYLTSHQSLDGYAKKDDIPSLDEYAKKSEIQSLGYVTKANLDNILKSYALAKYVYNKDYINDIISEIKTTYAKKKDIESIYMTSNEVKSTFLTKSDAKKLFLSKEDYRGNKSDVTPNDSISKEQLDNALSNIYNKDYIDEIIYDIKSTYVKYVDIESKYMTSNDANKTFLTKSDAQKIYLSKEDYRGIKSGISINDTYITKSVEEIQSYINNGKFFFDGLYIIKNGDVAIIKNNKIISINGGRFGNSGLFWEEED